jgi:HEAT repeats
MEHDRLGRLLPDGVDRRESDELDATWRMLGAIDAPAPNSERMRARLDAVIDAVEHTHLPARPRVFRTHVLQGLAAAAVLVIGIGIGWLARSERTRPAEASEITAMRSEMRDLREMVSLSLMQQQSASERLKGVSFTTRIEQPGNEVMLALLDALMHDPNVNVRLVTIDALKRFAASESVRRGVIEALARQTSPIVQIALIDFVVETNGRGAADALRGLAGDPMLDQAVRARATLALKQIG